MIKFGESGHPVFRATSPLSRGTLKSIGGGQFSKHFCADGDTIETVFRTIISVNQLSIHGAVSDLHDEYRACQARTVRPVLPRQSDPLFDPARLSLTTLTFSIEIPAQQHLLQKHKNEWKSFHNKIEWWRFVLMQDSSKQSKSDNTSWQSKLTSSYNLQSQWHVVNILFQEKKQHHNGNVGFKGSPKLDTYWKSQPVICKVNMEWKSELNMWTNTSLTRGSEFLMAWTNWSQTWSTRSATTTSRRPLQRRRKYLRLQADQRLQQNREDLPLLAHLQGLPILERIWIHIEAGAQFDQAYPVAKRLNTLLRHGELSREEDGAIWILENKDDLLNQFEYSQYWSDDVWKIKMAGGGGNKKRFQYCTDSSGYEILYLRALKDHSGRNPIDPTLHDSALIPNNFFEYIYLIGCAVNLHSITNSGLIAGGQNSSRERQTVFFTAVNPMNKNDKDPQGLDLTKPRLAWYKQK